jgi:hypothetical protein
MHIHSTIRIFHRQRKFYGPKGLHQTGVIEAQVTAESDWNANNTPILFF